MNIASWLERAGRSHPELPAIALGDTLVADYGRFARRSSALAGALRRRHRRRPGDRVAIVAANHPAYLESLFAIWWAGLVAVPVNSRLHASEIEWILGHAQAQTVLVSPGLEDSVAGVVSVVAFGTADYERDASGEPTPVEPRDRDDPAWLFYTSGTTGRPKGATLSHRNLAAMSLAYLADVDPTSPGDAILHAAPLSHGSGLYAIPHVCRMALSVVPESGRYEPPEVRELLQTWPRTSMFAAPTMIRRLVESGDVDTGAVRTIIWGGAPMPVPDVVRALDGLGPCLAQIYGQGETPMTITCLGKEDLAARAHPRWHRRAASAGTATVGIELRIADADDQAVPVGETGHVLVRGDTVMRGYWSDARATATALRGGWLHTGDLGSLDDDGYLTLQARSNDLIISGGSNVYPREVEDVLAAHPLVTEVAVIGRPDPDWGEVVVAYVVGEVPPAELDQICLDRIARFKRPKDYVFVSSLPKSNYGKVLRTELRSWDGAP